MNHKQKVTVSALIALLIALLVATWSGQEPVSHAQIDIQKIRSTSDATEWMDDARRHLGLANNIYLLAAASDEVTGDSIPDAVLLVGIKTTVEDRFARNIDIIVRDGKSGRFVAAGLSDVSGDESSLFIGDFNGDKVKDVMVTAPSSASINHTIAAFPDFVPSILFSSKENTGTAFSGRFLDGFQVELVNDDTGRKTRVDITEAKSRYIENGVYREDGKLLKSITPHAYPYSSLEAVDLNRDGVYELKGIQRIIGIDNTDVVAHIYSYWQYSSNQDWTLQQLEVASILFELSQENPPASVLASQSSVSKQMKSQYASVSYPQFEDISDLSTRHYVNQALETAARKLVNQGTGDNPIVVEYEVMRNDTEILSVIFKDSSQNQANNPSPVLEAVNIDLKSRDMLSVDKLFRSDRQSHRAINSLIAAAAKQAGIVDSPVLGDWIGMYITNEDIVLYDQESGQDPEYRYLSLPLEKTQAYLNEPYANVKGR
ncbi:MAG: hypothetical protein K0Q77_2000 [Anaerosporomusa subterranea]|jgi:hypothetical protein|nr:hypothetical protein [Anaerosporomusa subterranea]